MKIRFLVRRGQLSCAYYAAREGRTRLALVCFDASGNAFAFAESLVVHGSFIVDGYTVLP